MRKFTFGLSLAALVGALYVGAFAVGPIPPLGNLLDPAGGVWSLARSAELPATTALTLSGLQGAVEVKYDDRGVPHIFADHESDAYRALGWVHARDRLFQMELTQRAVAGTLTELVGARALPLDRDARRLALARAAEARWAAIPEGSPIRVALMAYMDGVNAYVANMGRGDLPLEYRLLNRTPRRFQPVDTYYLLGRMAQTLSYRAGELQRAAVAEIIGEAATDALFPINAPIQEPIEPVPGRVAARMDFRTPLPAPQQPTGGQVATARSYMEAARLTEVAGVPSPYDRGEFVVGSNNWAVAPQRTERGYALLAGDPHLELTLPSIWYEVHIVVKGGIDLYGVSLPLSPIVPIGFNRDVAWTATNTGNDVVDYYRETVDDAASPKKYQVDGEWRDVMRHLETYRDPSGAVIAEDTSFATHRGPLLQTSQGWLSERWVAREPSDEGQAFVNAIRATNAAEWYAAMESYKVPTQNFLVADREGTIAIRSNGRYPIRPGTGSGVGIFDGSTSASDWIGNQAVSWYPQTRNPAQGYIASANQQPVDPIAGRGYVGTDWPSPWRAMRINTLLRTHPKMTPDLMRQFHTDPQSELTPFVLKAVRDARDAAKRAGTWTTDDDAALALLDSWDGQFLPDASAPLLFDALVTELQRQTWDELVIPGENRRVATPGSMLLVRLLSEPNSVWWDSRATYDAKETRDVIVVASLRRAWASARERWGNDPTQWKWRNYRVANIRHMLRLPGMGREGIPMRSGPGTLSPSDDSGVHGASWRFVVEMGPSVQAWGTYPGGQSGNPVSSRYDDRIAQWRDGELAELRLPRAASELSVERTRSTVTMRPE